jgi:hypothetical protein
MVIYDPEYFKPTQCSECEGRNIVNPVNEHAVDLRCLDCGHEKAHVPLPHERPPSGGTYTPPSNPKSHREF